MPTPFIKLLAKISWNHYALGNSAYGGMGENQCWKFFREITYKFFRHNVPWDEIQSSDCKTQYSLPVSYEISHLIDYIFSSNKKKDTFLIGILLYQQDYIDVFSVQEENYSFGFF